MTVACRKELVRKVSEYEQSPKTDKSVAISLAGHLGLDNLILIYDNNNTTVDGAADNCFTDDTSARVKAVGWDVIDVFDRSNNVRRLDTASQLIRHAHG